ncbi:MAG: DNA alkylation repair protein [Rikenellaceae bacterium]|nr:DNA alkylation repair protein [Rikenellaceae bacterium]
MNDILFRIRKNLKDRVDEKTKENNQNFFKEKIIFYGVKVPMIHKISAEYWKEIKDRDKQFIYGLCTELWRSGILEESIVACDFSEKLENFSESSDFGIFEEWIKNHVNNWASCDTLCNHTIGSFVEKFPEYSIEKIKDWALSDNKWMRRAAAVTFIIPARKGRFLNDILEIADILLADPEDLVQKGYGWMLKAASEYYPEQIFNYVLKNKNIMPRTALRYAIEKLPPEKKKLAMAK